MAQCARCNAPISRLTEAVCWRCREILDRKIDAIQAQLYKFRAESETDSQPTMKPVGQYGRAVPQPGVRLKTTNALSDEQGQAEAEGRKRIEVACGPSRNRTLESGEAGEMKAGGDDSNATIGSASVGGLTARRDGQDYAGGGVDGYGGTMQRRRDIEKECEHCGSMFWTFSWEVKRGRGRFCTPSCSSKALFRPRDIRGEHNPNYKGGISLNKRRYTDLFRQRYPEKAHAHDVLRDAIRSGKILRPSTCSRCGTECTPHGHHEDYSKPLSVVWLCRRCHLEQHKQTPARQHSVPHHEGEGKSDAVKVKGMAEKLGDDSVLLRQASEGCEPLDVLVAGRSICSSHAEDNTAPKSAPPRYPMPPQRVRFGPGEVPVTEGRYQRYRREAQAYYDAMQRDVTSGHVWPVRECAGGCGYLVNGPLDECRLCAAKSKKQLQEVRS